MQRIITRTGRYIDMVEGAPSVEDLALGLTRTPLFAGQSADFYSLGHHCLHTSMIMPDDKIYGLLMDVHVPVLGGCPIQMQPPGYRRYASQIRHAFCQEHNIWPFDKFINTKINQWSGIDALAAGHVCGLPNVAGMSPMSPDLMTTMMGVRELLAMYPPSEQLVEGSPLQRKFTETLEVLLLGQLEAQDREKAKAEAAKKAKEKADGDKTGGSTGTDTVD